MNDLISRSEVKNIAKGFTFTFAEERQRYMDFLNYCLDNAPTVEAKPVVHGKWEQRTEWDEDNNAIFECTNCRHGDVQAKGAEVPYCWYCGADMRGGKNE